MNRPKYTRFLTDPNGQRVPEAVVVDEFRDLVDAIRPDLTKLSGEITARSFTEFDRALDLTDLASYLEQKGAGEVITRSSMWPIRRNMAVRSQS